MSQQLQPSPLESIFGQVIVSITRAELLQDGTLVDVSKMAAEAGFKVPVAITAEAWADCVAWTDDDSHRQTYQDVDGRLWDVLWMAHAAIQQARHRQANASSLPFQLYRIPADGRSQRPRLTQLKLVIGPGDHGEPVVTILLPQQD